MVDEQRDLNDKYVSESVEQAIPKDASPEDKKEIKQYNKIQKEIRKTELPPVSEALRLNCELLFALSEKLQIPAEEQKKIDSILRDAGESLFLVLPLENNLRFDASTEGTDLQYDAITFTGKKLSVPAAYLTDSAQISVRVESKSGTYEFADWIIQSVDRDKNDDNYQPYSVGGEFPSCNKG